MPREFLICAQAGQKADIPTAAERMFELIGAPTFEERESCNYPRGHYFKSTIDDLTIRISWLDDRHHSDMDYVISVDAAAMSKSDLRSWVDTRVASTLLPAGFRVARILNYGRDDEIRTDYLRND